MSLDWLGWLASAIFITSYLFKQQRHLRMVQASAALVWIAYGWAIGATPILVSNCVVAVVAIGSIVIRRSGDAGAALRERPSISAESAQPD